MTGPQVVDGDAKAHVAQLLRGALDIATMTDGSMLGDFQDDPIGDYRQRHLWILQLAIKQVLGMQVDQQLHIGRQLLELLGRQLTHVPPQPIQLLQRSRSRQDAHR